VSVQTADPALPSWARVSDARRAHIDRVLRLLDQWAAAMRLDAEEISRWRAAGLLHDALRDAPEALLRTITGEKLRAVELLHGPAAAIKAAEEGERRQDVLDAVRYHTLGWARWARTGRALYLADFLEPGRKFLISERAFIAAHVPHDLDAAFRECVRVRIQYALSQGGELFPESVELWNAVR